MTNQYNPSKIELKWQEKWEKDGLYHADIDPSKPKYYALTMLPYPSGDLHIGHWYAMCPSDARARYLRMKGYNVMFPMGFDAFGLPAENAAIERNVHPKEWTYTNIDRMRQQLRTMGAMFDWRRDVVSSDPKYYYWTQWYFLQLYKHGLAYRKMSPVDWCPKDNTTLAREQVWGEDRRCERCDTQVIKKDLEQWFFRTTSYAEELLDFSQIDWPERVELLQTNWIGRSEGASVQFPVIRNQSSVDNETSDDPSLITVFTTRPDTLWGATFMVLAPEHPLVEKVTTDQHRAEVTAYVEQAARRTDIEREVADREMTGVFTGWYAINPVNGERIQIWIADYVLITYGTGSIMAVPAHDQRDFEFARKYRLEVRPVIQPEEVVFDGETMTEAYDHEGIMINSGPFDGAFSTNDKGRKNPGISAVIDWLEEQGIGKESINYRLRDWLISRQRYWGAPIPMVYCETCGVQPVSEDQLPVLLPDEIEWRPTGESPLKFHPTWAQTTCPVCDEPALRETDTMDTFMCSSWYHLRYLSPDYTQGPFDPEEYDYWMPVDTYTGGIEHATMHLIYTRFFHKAGRDMDVMKGSEPMIQLCNQGIVLGVGEDSEKMSKSRGNVVAPDNLVDQYGADTVRGYLMFMARWDQGGPWNSRGIEGSVRWLRRVWALLAEESQENGKPAKGVERDLRCKVHQTLKSVTHDFETFEFNTIVSSLMELLNDMYWARDKGAVGTIAWQEAVDIYVRMMAPVTPHIAEELWTEKLGNPYSVHTQSWPELDEEAAIEDEITLVVQVNGKVRDRITVPANIVEKDAIAAALASEIVQRYLDGGKELRKVIVVPGRLVNIVV